MLVFHPQHVTCGLPRASSCSRRLVLARVTSASSRSYSLQLRSSSCEQHSMMGEWLRVCSFTSVRVSGVCDVQSWLVIALCRCWGDRSEEHLSAGSRSGPTLDFQSSSRSPDWLTVTPSPACAANTHMQEWDYYKTAICWDGDVRYLFSVELLEFFFLSSHYFILLTKPT